MWLFDILFAFVVLTSWGIIPLIGVCLSKGKALMFFRGLLLVWGVFTLGVLWCLIPYPHPRPDVGAAQVYYQNVQKMGQDGKTEVLLKDVTGFEWNAVCWVKSHSYYFEPDDSDKKELRDVTGESFDIFAIALEGEEYLLFGTPDGVLMLKPISMELAKRGYRAEIFSRVGGPEWQHLCLRPEEIGLRIEPSILFKKP